MNSGISQRSDSPKIRCHTQVARLPIVADARISKLSHDVSGVVMRGIVRDDNGPITKGLGTNALDCLPQELCPIIGWNTYRYLGAYRLPIVSCITAFGRAFQGRYRRGR